MASVLEGVQLFGNLGWKEKSTASRFRNMQVDYHSSRDLNHWIQHGCHLPQPKVATGTVATGTKALATKVPAVRTPRAEQFVLSKTALKKLLAI